MNEALREHLKEQAAAAECDWRTLFRRSKCWALLNVAICLAGGALMASHWWLREYDWPWLIVQLTGSSIQLGAMVSCAVNVRRSRGAWRAWGTMMGLRQRQLAFHLDALDRELEKRRRGY